MTAKLKKFTLLIDVRAPQFRRVRGLQARLKEAAAIVAEALPAHQKQAARRGAATLALITDSVIKRLNCDFRGIDESTNVLSFPHINKNEWKRIARTKDLFYIGDIAIAWQTTSAEASRDDKTPLAHTLHLAIHGMLHLFGYDHDKAAPAKRMERLETKLMRKLGFPDPYRPSGK